MTLAPERPTSEQPLAGCPRRRPAPPDPVATGRSSADHDDAPPRLADGVQLLGEYAGSGYVEPQYLARRPGGQLVQLSQLLHQVAEACDGSSSPQEIAERVTGSYGKPVNADNVRTLVETRLRPLGVLAAADGTSPPAETSDPLLGLKLRTQLLPPGVVRGLARLARPLFWPPIVLVVVTGLVALDGWLFFVHGVGESLRATVQQPAVFLLVASVVVVSAALHELGHAAACSYGGAKPGGMGAGIYVVWPAFYTDVTEAYQLDRRGRLRTDLGGIHVNAIIVLATAAVYAVTRYEPLVLLCFLLQIQVLQQLLPFLRLDGYYVLSDLVGVPDLFRRIGPVLRSSLPFREPEPAVTELKPWVRRVVAGWVFVLVPVLALNLGYFLLAAPRIAATSWDSASGFVGTMLTADGAEAAWAGVQLLLLLLPTVGITYTLARVARRGTAGAWRWSSGSLPRRVGVVTGGLALASLLAFAWYPDARLTPYREGERGTLQQHAAEWTAAGAGRPLLRSPQEAREPLEPVGESGSAVLDAVREPPGPSSDEPGARQQDPPAPVAETPVPTPTDSEGATSTTTEAPTSGSEASLPTSRSGTASPEASDEPTSTTSGGTSPPTPRLSTTGPTTTSSPGP